MKKSALIFLILIYSMSSFGVTFKQFYCCGKLKTVSVTLSQPGKDKAATDNDPDGCCKTKVKSFKVKDTHIATEKATTPLNAYVAFPVAIHELLTVPLAAHRLKALNGIHAPPLRKDVPIYLFNCVFRI